VDETAANNGISHLLEHMLFKGTARRTARDIAEEVEGVGGVLGAFTETENISCSVRILDRHLPLALDVLSDIVLNSTVPGEELEKEKNVVAEEIRLYEDMPHDKVHELIMAALLPGQPAGLPILGSLETLTAFARDDLRQFMARSFTADRIVISGAGYFDPTAFTAQVEEYFAATPTARAREAGPTPPWPASKSVVVKESEQTHFCLGYPALPFDHPDRYALGALTVILGGNTSSRLFRTVREERGLAYDVYAYSHSFRANGVVVAYAGTAPENALETRRLILEQFEDIAARPVGDDELARTKEYLKGTLMLSLESTSSRAMRNARHEIYLGRYVPLEETIAGVDAVTADDVRRVAGALFGAPPTAVAIGPNAEAVAAG